MTTAQIARIALGVLLAINLVGVGLVLYPPGGSAESLDAERESLRQRLTAAKAELELSKKRAEAVKQGQGASDEFVNRYFVPRRAIPSTLLRELGQIAQKAGVKDRGTSYSGELIEGSDVLGLQNIAASFEGNYRNLLNFVREVDRSDSLLIIESLNAIPVSEGKALQVQMKLQGFSKEDVLVPLEAASLETPQEAAR
jgi:hypothetical protein